MTEKTFTCVICPMGCELTVRYDEKAPEDLSVSGNTCPRGAKYAKSEILHPERTLTGTVHTDSSVLPMCPVKTNAPIPKDKLLLAMTEMRKYTLSVPIHSGDVVAENFMANGVSLIACRTILS